MKNEKTESISQSAIKPLSQPNFSTFTFTVINLTFPMNFVTFIRFDIISINAKPFRLRRGNAIII